jgi:LysR family transcriptional regulator, hydrogen peroxide-inducible genes activator
MTITQMEYIAAVDKYGSFVTAAEKCNVTQPTLSMQIQKLEDELSVKIFDRNHHPIASTEMGAKIINQVRNVLFEVSKIHELIISKKEEFNGKLNLGILPTLAPYLLPKMLSSFLEKYPNVELQIFELTTDNIIKQLKEDKLDFGILATPLHDKELKESPIFYEQFVAYFGSDHKLLAKKSVAPSDLELKELWTLNDEHCMHFQAINLCDEGSSTKNKTKTQLQYQTGTIQSLVKMVETNGGCTIIPELAIEDMYEHQLENIRYFSNPEPVREVSLVTNRYFVKSKLATAFIQQIAAQLPENMLISNKKRKIVDIS